MTLTKFQWAFGTGSSLYSTHCLGIRSFWNCDNYEICLLLYFGSMFKKKRFSRCFCSIIICTFMNVSHLKYSKKVLFKFFGAHMQQVLSCVSDQSSTISPLSLTWEGSSLFCLWLGQKHLSCVFDMIHIFKLILSTVYIAALHNKGYLWGVSRCASILSA